MSTPIERLTQESQLFAELQASRYRFMAYFGEKAARPFDEIRAIHRQVITAADGLVRAAGEDMTRGGTARRAQWRNGILWGAADHDETPRRLHQIVQAIEHTCRPLIAESRSDLKLSRRWLGL